MMNYFKRCFAVCCLLFGTLSCATPPEHADTPGVSPASAITNVPGTTKGVIADIESFERPADAKQIVWDDSHIMVVEPGPGTNWTFENGELTASTKIRGDSMLTPEPHGDMLMHVEFNVNDNGDDNREKNGNSGVYIQQRYELQITNAYGVAKEDYKKGYNGSMYRMKMPDQLASKPAGQWQTYIIVFRAPRWDGDKKTENARITVYHNGVLIHDDYEMKRKTGAGKRETPADRPTRLQGHSNPVRFRNVWIKDLDLK